MGKTPDLFRIDFNRRLREMLIKDEGYEKFPYRDTTGHITIGIGHNLSDNGLPDHIIERLFLHDIQTVEKQLRGELSYWKTLPDNARLVLLNMGFNLGINGLLQFKRMLAHVRLKEWKLAADEMLNSRWARQVGDRATRLAKLMREA